MRVSLTARASNPRARSRAARCAQFQMLEQGRAARTSARRAKRGRAVHKPVERSTRARKEAGRRRRRVETRGRRRRMNDGDRRTRRTLARPNEEVLRCRSGRSIASGQTTSFGGCTTSPTRSPTSYCTSYVIDFDMPPSNRGSSSCSIADRGAPTWVAQPRRLQLVRSAL